MSWQDSFVPDASQAVQSQGWQSSFVPDNQPANQNNNYANYKGSVLPFSNDAEGNTHFDINAGISGSLIKGAQDLMNPESYPSTSGTEQGGQLSPDALGVLAGISGATMSGKMGPSTSNEPPSGSGPVIPTSGDIELIKKKLDLAGITPQQYADALINSSPDDFAGELGGDPLRMQTQAQAKITGPAMQAARDAMRQRLDTAPQRVQQIIENTFYPSSGVEPTVGGDVALAKGAPAPIEPVQQMQGNLDEIKGNLPDLYSAAENSTVPRRPFINIINTPNGQTAMKNTVQRLANQNITPEQAGIVVDPNTGFHGLQTNDIPVSTMQEVSKSLGDLVKRNPNTGAIEDSDSLVAEGQRQHISDYLSENSPEFNKANMNAAANFQGNDAFDAGRQLAHAAAGDKADALASRANDVYSAQELAHRKAGYAQGLADAIQGSPLGGGNPASRIAKGTIQNTAADVLQSPTQAQNLADALMQEKNRIDLAQRGLGGSNTAETLSAGEVPKVPASPEGLLNVAAGKALDFVNAGKNARIAQLLYATSPEQKSILAQKILQ